MAKMGQRKVNEKKKGGGELSSPALGLSVVIPTMQVEVVTTTVVVGSTLGIPIMREGFVTETGFLPSSTASAALVSTSLTRQ